MKFSRKPQSSSPRDRGVAFIFAQVSPSVWRRKLFRLTVLLKSQPCWIFFKNTIKNKVGVGERSWILILYGQDVLIGNENDFPTNKFQSGHVQKKRDLGFIPKYSTKILILLIYQKFNPPPKVELAPQLSGSCGRKLGSGVAAIPFFSPGGFQCIPHGLMGQRARKDDAGRARSFETNPSPRVEIQ